MYVSAFINKKYSITRIVVMCVDLQTRVKPGAPNYYNHNIINL